MLYTPTSFAKANPVHSRQIYKSFCGKSVINKKVYSESNARFISDPLYNELIENLDHYELLYLHIGYRLTHETEGEYFYVKSLSDEDETDESFDEVSLKIMAVLSLFARIATHRQQSLSTLGSELQGVTVADLDLIDSDDEMLSILRALKFKNASDAIELLKKNGFAFRVMSNRYVLSKGAMVMIGTLIEHFKAG